MAGQSVFMIEVFIDKLVHLFFCSCKFHCFTDENKRIAITLTADFLLRNGYMGIANVYFREMENISYHVAAGHIDEELLTELMTAILDNTYDNDEALKLKLFNAILLKSSFTNSLQIKYVYSRSLSAGGTCLAPTEVERRQLC